MHPVSLLVTMELTVQKLSKSNFLERACSNRLIVLLNGGFRFNVGDCALGKHLYHCNYE